MSLRIGIGLGIPFGKRGGVDWSAYWADSGLFLFFGFYSEISDGQMPNKVTGATDFLTVAGVAGSETYQCPNTAPYIAADTDYLWFRQGDSSQRITTTENLIGFDFPRTLVKYADSVPYAIDWIGILNVGETVTDNMRDSFHLSVWWDNILNAHGYVKGNRGVGQSVWNLGYADETVTYITRLEADGGAITVAEAELTDADVRFLKSVGVYTDLTRILLPYGGKKLRNVGADYFIEKWYDVKGVGGDVTQTTEAEQPKYGAAQYNGIDIITCSSSMMLIPAINIVTLITVNSGTGFVFGLVAGGAYIRNQTTTSFLVRDDLGDTAVHTVIDKTFKIDSVIRSGGNVSIWRNKTASASNPLAKGNITVNMLFKRSTSYWVGTAGIFLIGGSAITTTKRELVEDYYIALFNIV